VFEVNKGLFLVKCAKIDHKGNVLTPHKYRIFPRTYAVSTQGYILSKSSHETKGIYERRDAGFLTDFIGCFPPAS
jgi:hypothetical protein